MIFKSNYINNFSFCIFQIFAIIISCTVMLVSHFLGGKSYGIDKNIPFESGACSFGNSQIKIFIKFYLIAMFFVIFDIEAMYLYIWSISIKKIKLEGFIEGLLFIITILISLFYLFRVHALNWKSKKYS
ncbi:NADH-quinone oxidoreductase subunit A [Enterobacteriaceae endosymbiont of Plateumaris rustica]|uniref:NADH-quinone oxidoreductase subunit A n=1 Tax=Enterobacteriaceae endosymbiont of Plateumaris rustica TaxID=2675796 RepID=UPI001449CB66|nr:NADH-quinone oxidoreductase subunit A [Enterobacteriaceae endosymbiont of Plateumaris rustica]QJC29221.1 NADH-quinone oxidoreductase subunit A [Enterobacteriaceae endosymbiont of Plateumaris rustica]